MRCTSERQYLSSKSGYGYKSGSIAQQNEHALQWYTVQYNKPYFQITLETYGFQNIPNFLW